MPSSTTSRSATDWYTYRIRDEYCNGTVVDTGTVNYFPMTRNPFERNKTWVRTPDYRQRVERKQHLPDNPFFWEQYTHRQGHYELQRRTTNPCVSPTTLRQQDITDNPPWLIVAVDKGSQFLTDSSLRAKLIDRAKGAEWSAPTFFGEARQTISMVANAARTIASSYRDLRRGNLSGALGSLGISGTASQRRRYYREYGLDPSRAAANHWLALTYGWRPLVNDVYNAATTLAELSENENAREGSVRAVTRLDYVDTIPSYPVMISPASNCLKTRISKESFRGKWRFQPTDWNAWGSFGALNPAAVAWELLPFSFVVDWFLPVGRYLEGLDVTTRFNTLGGYIGYRREVKVELEDPTLIGLPCSGSSGTTYTVVTRTPLTSAPVLGADTILEFAPKLGAGRITSAMALMSQVFRR